MRMQKEGSQELTDPLYMASLISSIAMMLVELGATLRYPGVGSRSITQADITT